MAKAEKITDTGLLSVAVTLYVVNCTSVWIGDFPFLYCWGGPLTSFVYLNFGPYVVYGLAVYIVIQLLRRQLVKCFWATVILIVVFELPRIFDIVFRMGGSCGT